MIILLLYMIPQSLFKFSLYRKHLDQPNADSWTSTHQLAGAGPGTCIFKDTPQVVCGAWSVLRTTAPGVLRGGRTRRPQRWRELERRVSRSWEECSQGGVGGAGPAGFLPSSVAEPPSPPPSSPRGC